MAKSSLNILVLHGLGDPNDWIKALADHELCLPMAAPQHNYLLHDYSMQPPPYLADIAFDGVILTQTFLRARVHPSSRRALLSRYGKLLESDCFKIALPQDDYRCCSVLDEWLVRWRVGLVYPVCGDDWSVFYPLYAKQGRLKQGFTGYISDDLINRSESRKSISLRSIDVAYRAFAVSPICGRMGQTKNEFGARFQQKASGHGLRVNISTDPVDAIRGTKWYDFVASTRAMLGTRSGSSLLDRDGQLTLRVAAYQALHPSANFAEVESACFAGQDGSVEFSAISPRNFECGVLGTAQLLEPGPYSGLMRPWDHFIPLHPDMSNVSSVIPLLRDDDYLQQTADRCREELLSHRSLRYSSHVAELVSEIETHTRVSDRERERGKKLIQTYRADYRSKSIVFWRRSRVIAQARGLLGNMGLRRARALINTYLLPANSPI